MSVKKSPGNSEKRSAPVPFRPAPDVEVYLAREKSTGANISELVNEALRLHGDDAILNVLKEKADEARARFDRVLKYHQRRKRKPSSPADQTPSN